MPLIYHITSHAAWQQAERQGSYTAASLQQEGFIHCCASDKQVEGVLQRYFKDQVGLVKLVIDTGRLSSLCIYEWSPSVADTFPHIYGPVNLEAVVGTAAI